MKHQSQTLKRLLSLALCLCMVLALVPVFPQTANAADNIPVGIKLYLKPNSNWKQDGARFAAYFFGSANTWVSMTATPGEDGVYECTVPNGTWTNVIFCRMNPNNTTNNWNNKWNQTGDLTVNPDKTLFVASAGWDSMTTEWKNVCDELDHSYSGLTCTRCNKTKCQIKHGHTFNSNNVCSVCNIEGRVVYFQNSWEWQDVNVHYWKSGGVETAWPGNRVAYHGEATVNGVKKYYSKMVVPSDVTGFIINGTNNSNTGTNKVDQTVTLTLDGWYDGITYYIDQEGFTTAADGHHECKVKNFPICNDFSAEHKYDANNTCTRCSKTKCQINGHKYQNDVCTVCELQGQTIYFQNNKFWDDVRVYYWTGEGNSKVDNGWPGVYMEHVGDAMGSEAVVSHYKLTIPANVDGFIISGAGETRPQTQNLTLEGLEYPDTFFIDTDGTASTFKLCLALTGMHNWQTLEAVEATCTQEGKAEGQKCAYCETVKQEITPVKPHNQDGDICADCGAELMDIYFENSWKWENVKIYYWFADKRPVPAYPGVAMEVYGTNNGNYYFGFKIPKDVAGFVFSGTGTGNSAGQKEETVNIESGWYNGATYYPDKRVDGKETDKCTVGNFPICVDFPRNHKFNDNKCAFCGNPEYIWIFLKLKDEWGWSNVEIHYQGSRIANNDLAEVSIPMTLWEEGSNIYYAEIPADPDFICFTGSDFTGSDDFESKLIESGWTHGTLYELDDKGYNTRDTITSVYPCALGHDFKAVVTDPTCISEGFTTYTCARIGCGTIERGDSVAKNPDNHAGELIYVDNGNGTHHQKWNCCDVVVIDEADHKDANNKGLCDDCGGLTVPALLIQTSASLKGNIAVNYYMLLTEEVKADETAYMQFTIEGHEDPYIVSIADAQIIGEYYVFSCDVTAKEMTKMIYSQFFYEGGKTTEHRYSVQTYAEHILNNPDYDDEITKNLINSMLNYGAASQTYFGFNTEKPANAIAGVTAPDYSNMSLSGYDYTPNQGTEWVHLYSASLILKSETTLRLFFDYYLVSAKYGDQELDIQYRGGLYYVDITGISAKDLDENVTITIFDGRHAEVDIVFNPMAYCQIVVNDTTGAYVPEMKQLAYALYLYNQAANDYFDRFERG